MKKETREQLEIFRMQQEEAERKALEEDNSEVPTESQVQWAAPGRKRKKGPDSGLLKGVKLRKSNPAAAEQKSDVKSEQEMTAAHSLKATTGTPTTKPNTTSAVLSTSKAPSTLSLGLGYASSDDDD